MKNATPSRSISLLVAVSLGASLLAAIAGSAPARAQQMLPCDYGGYDPGSYSHVSDPGPYKKMQPKIVELDSDLDGATIQMGIVRPKVPGGVKVPVIVDASPYYHPLQTVDLEACRPFLVNNYVPQGYAVVLLAIRGTADSGGCMNLMGPQERADLDQAVTWLGQQAWSNGSVGMIGKSYDGSTPWMVAARGNPHLKTIVTASGVPDLFVLMYGSGTPDWRGPAILNDIYYAESMFFYLPGRSPEHTAEVFACPEYATGTAASLHSAFTGMLDPFGYWEERRYRRNIVRNYGGSVFLIQGLQDWNVNPGQQYPWIENLETGGVYVKHLLGQWGHSWPDQVSRPHLRPDFADILLDWFDHWLKDDSSAPLGPKAQLEDSSGTWRNSANWPPKGAQRVSFWLTPDDALSFRPSKSKDSEMITADPFHTQGGWYTGMPPEGFATMCAPGCAYFETAEFEKEFRVSGLPRLNLGVVPTGPGGGLSAYLYSVSPEGATRIGWGQVNLAFKAPGEPRPVVPGEKLKLRFDLQPLDAVVPAGARLALVVSQGSAYNRLQTAPYYPVELLKGKRRSSLRVLRPTPDESDFFEPPQR